MMISRLLARACVAASLLAAAWPASAALVVYTDRGAFLSALGAHGEDGFDDLAAGGVLPGPLSRQAGMQGYRVSVPDTLGYGAANYGDAFYPVAPQGSPALSPNYAAYALAFDQFGSGTLRGFGADFSATDVDGLAASGALKVSVTVGGAAQLFDLLPGGGTTFWGLLSSADDLSAWSVVAVQGGAGDRFATVDNLVLSTVGAVPEPSSLALMLAAGLGLLAVRRRC